MNEKIRNIKKKIEDIEIELRDANRDFVAEVHTPIILGVLEEMTIEVFEGCVAVAYIHTHEEDPFNSYEYADIHVYNADWKIIQNIPVWNRYVLEAGQPGFRELLDQKFSDKDLYHLDTDVDL